MLRELQATIAPGGTVHADRHAGRDPGGDHRRRAGRARARPPARRPAASTASCSSSTTASTSSTASAPACSSTRPSSCSAASALADRLDREGLAHRGIQLAFEGRRHRIDFLELAGQSITVYGQQEVVKDLIAARLAAGDPIVFEALDVEPVDVDTDTPVVRYRARRRAPRAALPDRRRLRRLPRREPRRRCPDPAVVSTAHYPFAWLGILAEAAPTQDELVYSSHERGFALYSMRSPTITRLYLQVAAGRDARRLVRRPHLVRAGRRRLPTERRVPSQHRADPRQAASRRCAASCRTPMRHGNLRDRRRRRPHRAGDRRQGDEPGDRRRRRAGRHPRRRAQPRPRPSASPTTPRPASAGCGGPALLVVDDVDAPPLRRRPVPAASCSCPSCASSPRSAAAATDLAENYVGSRSATRFPERVRMTTRDDWDSFAPPPPGTHPPLDSPDVPLDGAAPPATRAARCARRRARPTRPS